MAIAADLRDVFWHFGDKHGIMVAEGGVMVTKEIIDWSECPLVEINPEVQSSAPVLRGTRMPVSAIVDNFDYGVSVAEIAEQFEVPQDRIEAILAYAKSHRVAHPV
jgi:uncharacterized protein (DUF433 family)